MCVSQGARVELFDGQTGTAVTIEELVADFEQHFPDEGEAFRASALEAQDAFGFDVYVRLDEPLDYGDDLPRPEVIQTDVSSLASVNGKVPTES